MPRFSRPCENLAHPEGLEPPALWFEARCSIQLSYGCVRFSLREKPGFGVRTYRVILMDPGRAAGQ